MITPIEGEIVNGTVSRANATSAPRSSALLPGRDSGRDFMRPESLPKATIEPVKVTAPMNTPTPTSTERAHADGPHRSQNRFRRRCRPPAAVRLRHPGRARHASECDLDARPLECAGRCGMSELVTTRIHDHAARLGLPHVAERLEDPGRSR